MTSLLRTHVKRTAVLSPGSIVFVNQTDLFIFVVLPLTLINKLIHTLIFIYMIILEFSFKLIFTFMFKITFSLRFTIELILARTSSYRHNSFVHPLESTVNIQLAELQKNCISGVPALEQISAHSVIRKWKLWTQERQSQIRKENCVHKGVNHISYQYTVPNRASKNLR